jgi:acyl dehydratase
LNPASRFFEDINVGDERLTDRIVLTEGHVYGFGGLSGDLSPVHFDDAFALSLGFGGRVIHGLLGLAMADGMKVNTQLFPKAIALGWSWQFKHPIQVGDKIQLKFRVKDKRESQSRRGMGIVTLELQLLNQEGTIVQEGEHQLMMPRSQATASDYHGC